MKPYEYSLVYAQRDYILYRNVEEHLVKKVTNVWQKYLSKLQIKPKPLANLSSSLFEPALKEVICQSFKEQRFTSRLLQFRDETYC